MSFVHLHVLSPSHYYMLYIPASSTLCTHDSTLLVAFLSSPFLSTSLFFPVFLLFSFLLYILSGLLCHFSYYSFPQTLLLFSLLLFTSPIFLLGYPITFPSFPFTISVFFLLPLHKLFITYLSILFLYSFQPYF